MKITIFEEYDQKGQYFIDEQGITWLHGTLLAKRLGFKNTAESITKHTDEDERRKEELDGRLVWYVSEPGVWGMILAAKTPEAKVFKRKLKHEILPKLRASGYYVAAGATSEQLEAAEIEIAELKQQNLLAESKIATLEEEQHRITEAAFDYFQTMQIMATACRDMLSCLGYLEFTKKKSASEVKELAISAVSNLLPHRRMIENIYLYTVSYSTIKSHQVREYLEGLFKHLANCSIPAEIEKN